MTGTETGIGIGDAAGPSSGAIKILFEGWIRRVTLACGVLSPQGYSKCWMAPPWAFLSLSFSLSRSLSPPSSVVPPLRINLILLTRFVHG